MKVPFGFCAVNYKNERRLDPVVWDSDRLINGHTLLVGMSGAGKTHTLRRMLFAMQKQSEGRTRFHVFDVHGDIKIQGASTVRFAELTEFGLNPLRVDPDRHFGGVRRCIQNFIATINRASSTPLGIRQESVIRTLLLDVYLEHGFHPDRPDTWKISAEDERLVSDGSDGRLYLDVPFAEKDEARALGARWDPEKTLWWIAAADYVDGITKWRPKQVGRTMPSVADLLRHANRVLKLRMLGSDEEAVRNLEKFIRNASALTKRQIDAARDTKDGPGADVMEALEKARDKAIESYVRYVSSIRTGKDFDMLTKYDSAETIKSIVVRLESLLATGLFKSGVPPFDQNASVWTYDLQPLDRSAKRMFVYFRLHEILAEAMRRGEQKELRDVIVLDEAHLYVDNDDDNILNIMAREARKFGVAVIAANQNADLPDGFLSSLATKIVLGIDEMYWRQAESKMRIDERLLAWIRPREFMAVQLKEVGETRNQWRWVILPPAQAGEPVRLSNQAYAAVPAAPRKFAEAA